MPEFPEELLAIIKECAQRHQESITDAVKAAEPKIRKSKAFAKWEAQFVTHAIRDLIHRARHEQNVATRKEAGIYGGPAKVVADDTVGEIASTTVRYLNYCIAGRTLGGLSGAELDGIADSEQNKADGAAFNARLCRELTGYVQGEALVRDVMTEASLRALFRKVAGITGNGGVIEKMVAADAEK